MCRRTPRITPWNAAQQTYIEVATAGGVDSGVASMASENLASAYAVAYPIGVMGVILVIIVLKALFKIDPQQELEAIKASEDTGHKARRMHVAVENPAIFGKKLFDVIHDFGQDDFVVSRVMKGEEVLFPTPETILEEGDKILIVTSQDEVDKLRILFGEEVPMHRDQWQEMDHHMVTRRVVVTKPSLTGKTL